MSTYLHFLTVHTYIYIYIYDFGSAQTYTKLKIYNHQTPKYSGNKKKTNIRKYF